MIIKNWKEFSDFILQYDAHQDIEFDKRFFRKEDLQALQSIWADSDGQKENYRISLPDGKGIHIKEYENTFKVHWDKSDPRTDPIGHLLKDAPHHIPTIGVGILLIAAAYIWSKK